MNRLVYLYAAAALLSACATTGPVTYDLALMRRDSGARHVGALHGRGNGTGTAEVTIEGVPYSGPAARVGLSETTRGASFSFGGPQPKTTLSTVESSRGASIRALLSSPTGRGLRCEFYANGGAGGTGACVDDDGHAFDAVFTMR